MTMSSRFNPQITYYDPQKKAESLFSIFLVGLFFPRRMFTGLPAASGLKNSAVLLACYLAVPSILMTTTFGAVASSLAPNFFVGIVVFISILPISLVIGVSSSWLWAKYLSWALSHLSGKNISTEAVFQVCAYSGPPFVIAWGPYLGPVMALWNLLLNWKGLKHHCGVGYGLSLIAMFSGIALLAIILIVIFILLFLLLPENVNMLLESLALIMQQRGWL